MSNIRISLAFIIVLAIWSTTPLAIQWSSDDSPLTSVLYRMLIGMIFCLITLLITQVRLPFNHHARRMYLVAGLAIFGPMTLVYLAAQSVPSGWISILFGLSPLITGVISTFIDPGTSLSRTSIIGILLGILGLILVFFAGLSLSQDTIPGIVMLMIAVLISASSSVLIKHIDKNANLSPMQTSVGALIVALPLFALVAWLNEPIGDITFSKKAVYGILYLGVIGTGIGFTFYYYLLKHLSASKVALIMLITPVSSLLIGNLINDEPVLANVWIGAVLVCVGLFLYEYKPRFGIRKL